MGCGNYIEYSFAGLLGTGKTGSDIPILLP